MGGGRFDETSKNRERKGKMKRDKEKLRKNPWQLFYIPCFTHFHKYSTYKLTKHFRTHCMMKKK